MLPKGGGGAHQENNGNIERKRDRGVGHQDAHASFGRDLCEPQ